MMKKLILLFSALTLSVGLWAETQKVSYVYPEYNYPNDPTSGIKEWKTGEVEATIVIPENSLWYNYGYEQNDGWYVVNSEVLLVNSAVCQGDIHLILADGAKLTTGGNVGTAGIKVSGEGNSLTIYGQTNQTGKLIAIGQVSSAGIGGETNASGSNITINGGIIESTGAFYAAGIGGGRYSAGYNITINGGKVTATAGTYAAGIGGGSGEFGKDSSYGSNITINGGEVTAQGWLGAGIGGGNYSDGSNIIINGGTVTAGAISGNGAGIGGGATGSGYDITISGGIVTATGGINGSGIGGGFEGNGSNIKVATNFTVRADNSTPPTIIIAPTRPDDTDIAEDLNGKRYVAIRPIGGVSSVTYGDFITVNPEFQSGTKVDYSTPITFTAADRTAEGFNFLGFYKDSTFDTPITEGVSGQTYTIVIEDTDISVYAKYEGTKHTVTYGDYISVSPTFTSGAEILTGTQVTFTAADHTAEGYKFYGFYKESTFDTLITEGVSGQTCTVTVANAAISVYAKYRQFTSVPYIDADGQEKQADAFVVGSATNQVTWPAGWYVVIGEDEQLSKGAVCKGDIHLILADGAKLTTTGAKPSAGIQVSGEGNSLTIYGQAVQSGQLIATGGYHGAGIGGGEYGSGSYITINGGTVTATGGYAAAGIGGGLYGYGSNITINGGTVSANGGEYAAGIGGVTKGSGSYITINGGTVLATGGKFAAGIGGGSKGSGSYITINGGTVSANGGEDAAGIGGGNGGSGSNIKVAANLIIKADNNNPPKTIIAPTHTDDTDIANELSGKKYVNIHLPIISVAVKTAPTKVNYIEGEKFDPAGLVITATYGDGSTEDFSYEGYADYISLNPSLDVPLQTTDTQVIISYEDLSCTQAITVVATIVTSIAIKTAPTKLEYNVGEHFDPTDLVITAAYDNGKSVDIAYSEHSSDFTFNPALDAALQISDTEVTITYGVKSCTQPIVMFDKAAALAEIAAAMEGNEDSEYLNGLVATQVTAIKNATTAAVVNSNKEEAIAIIKAAIPAFKAIKAEGDAAGYERAKGDLLGDMATHCTGCTAVDVKKGEKVVTLYAPENVKYKKIED